MNRNLHSDYYRNWCLILLDEFARLTNTISALRQLRTPNIVVSSHMTRTLGMWTEENREISISAALLDQGSIEQVLAVFHHEVAHQLVSELYGIAHAKQHGEAFRRACDLLGIPAQARSDFVLSDSQEHRLAGKVRKLLAMGSSTNRHEAEVALSKAREIMLRHNIALAETAENRYRMRPVGPCYGRVPSYTWAICSIVSDFYFCQYICRSCMKPDGKVKRVIELYGEEENLEIGEYIFHFLLNQGELEWQRYRKTNRTRGRRAKLSFFKGLYAGFRQKLEEKSRTLEQENALIWLGDPKLEAFFRQRNPHVRTRSVRSPVQKDVHSDGHEIGRKLRVNPGIRSDSNDGQPRLLL